MTALTTAHGHLTRLHQMIRGSLTGQCWHHSTLNQDCHRAHQPHLSCTSSNRCKRRCRRDAVVRSSKGPAVETEVGHEDITEDYFKGEDALLDDALDSGMDSVYEEEDEDVSFEAFAEDEEQDEDQPSPSLASIDIERVPWGRQALEVAKKVLQMQELEGLELYSFQAVAKGAGLDVRLDKVNDRYGSPSMDEVTLFARAFYRELEAALGEEEAGAVTVEVSSPGANRQLQIPRELKRFKDLPMSVTYSLAPDDEKISNRILQILELQETEGQSTWALADVKANRTNAKGIKLTRRQAAERFVIPLKNLLTVKLYVDF